MIAQCGDKIAVYESEAILRMDGNFIGSVNGEFWLREFWKVTNISAVKNV